MIGDGGQSGFDVAIPEFRFHNFTNVTPEVNFNNGNIGDWIWIADPVAHGGEFYAPVISDPVVSKTMFARHEPYGVPDEDRRPRNDDDRRGAAALQHMDRRLRRSSAVTGPSSAPTRLTRRRVGRPRRRERRRGRADFRRHGDRLGGDDDRPGLRDEERRRRGRDRWSGRQSDPGGDERLWHRIDQTTTPNRFVSSIHVDATNGNRAWVSYSGYSVNTPATPGHVFEVVFDPATGRRRGRTSATTSRTCRSRTSSATTRPATCTRPATSVSSGSPPARRPGGSPLAACRTWRSPA